MISGQKRGIIIRFLLTITLLVFAFSIITATKTSAVDGREPKTTTFWVYIDTGEPTNEDRTFKPIKIDIFESPKEKDAIPKTTIDASPESALLEANKAGPVKIVGKWTTSAGDSNDYIACVLGSADACSGVFTPNSLVKINITLKQYEAAIADSDEDEVSSCSISGVGWIVCPVVNFLAGIADGAFNVLSDSFLNISPKLFDTKQSTYTAWSAMRSLANDTGCPCRK